MSSCLIGWQKQGHFYVCGSARQVPEDIYTAMKEAMDDAKTP